MKYPNWKTVDLIREIYPKDTVVSLRKMEDAYAPPKGTIGVVDGVDDAANILISWQNGSHLSAIFGVDEIDIVLPGKRR